MRASWSVEGEVLRLTLRLDVEDLARSRRSPHLRMMTNEAHFGVPGLTSAPHPDLLALAAYAVAWPWPSVVCEWLGR